MSILRLKKCAIIAVNTIMSIWLIRAILFFVKTEHGKPILSDHIEDVKALIYILDTYLIHSSILHCSALLTF